MGACASNSSMDKIAFTKMEGCGNDYLFVDALRQPFPLERAAALSRAWSDRHFRVGADRLTWPVVGQIVTLASAPMA